MEPNKIEPKNLRDALAAEMLGDIGKLHDQITKLETETLPKFIAEAKSELAPLIGAIIKAGTDFEALMENRSKAHKDKVMADVEVEVDGLKRKIFATLGATVDDIMTVPASEAADNLYRAATQLVTASNKVTARDRKVAIYSSAITGVIVLIGVWALFICYFK